MSRFSLGIWTVLLTGTTDSGHLREDLGDFDFRLGSKDVAWIEGLARP